jgi:hypothetical protein
MVTPAKDGSLEISLFSKASLPEFEFPPFWNG